MTEAALQDWLFDSELKQELQQLASATAVIELDNVIKDPSLTETEFDWKRLILAASILSRSEKRPHKEAALRIATAALLLDDQPTVHDAAAVLLGKLANHRALALAVSRNQVKPDLPARLGVSLRMEDQRRRLESSVLLGATSERLQVNEFQSKFWAAANIEGSWLSASAPTASGKTYLTLKWLIDTLHEPSHNKAIYLAPTRALVSEIETSLHSLAQGLEIDIEVTSIPSKERFERDGKTIFVFTQERLHLFANMLVDDLKVDILIVDEAHKIGDQQRGVILQDAVERLMRTNSRLRVVFVSPATQNPELLLDDAPPGTVATAVDSDVPTVLQNIVVARQVPKKPKKWLLQLVYGDSQIPLGELQLAN